MEAVDLQAKKMGAQDSASSTEKSLGVTKVVSISDSKPPKQLKGKKRLGRCYRCGQEGHFSKAKSCPARQSVCTKCKKESHYANVCKTKPSNDSATGNKSSCRKRELGETKYLEEVVEENMEDEEVLGISATKVAGKDGHTPIFVSVMLDQKCCKMQLDSGATVSIPPKVLYDQQFNQWPLRGTKIKLKAYSGVRIPVYGEVHLPVVYEQQELVLPLIVVDGDPSTARQKLVGATEVKLAQDLSCEQG